jgi:hypothetical protein
MLLLHPKREIMTVRQTAPDQWPQNGFLRKGMGEDQPIDGEQNRILISCGKLA